MATYRLTYPSVLEAEQWFQDELLEILAGHAITGGLRHAIRLVASEAFANALVHGNELDPAKLIMIRLEIGQEHIRMEVADQGASGLTRLRNQGPAGLLSEHGRGLDLIKHYDREAQFIETAEGGLKVTVRFDRKTDYSNHLSTRMERRTEWK